jgi:calcineurin-like phosphoesterase family protein
MKTYIIADTHLNHDKIKTYCDRPDDFTQREHHNIITIVKPEDLLIHVGDLGIGPWEGYIELVKHWPCRKVLVRGNHDGKSCQWYMEHGFDFACDSMIYRGVYFTHKPSDFLPPGAHVNVHGHLHNIWDGFCENDPEAEDDLFQVCGQLGRLPQPFNRLFAVEYTEYRPVEMDKFVSKPDKYQARGPNQETRERRKLLEEARKCAPLSIQESDNVPCYEDLETELLTSTTEIGGGYVAIEACRDK